MSLLLLLPREIVIGIFNVWVDIFALPQVDSAFCNVARRKQLLAYFGCENLAVKNFDDVSIIGLLNWITTRNVKLKVLQITKDFGPQHQSIVGTLDRSALATITIIDESLPIVMFYGSTYTEATTSSTEWFHHELFVEIVNNSPRLTAINLVGSVAHLTDFALICIDNVVLHHIREISLVNCAKLTSTTIELISQKCFNLIKIELTLPASVPSQRPPGYGWHVHPPMVQSAGSVLTENAVMKIVTNNPELRQIKVKLDYVTQSFFERLTNTGDRSFTDVCFAFVNTDITSIMMGQVVSFLLTFSTIQYAKFTFRGNTTIKVTTNNKTKVGFVLLCYTGLFNS
jgi:hypothetical protein